MFDNENEYTGKNKTFFKLLHRIFDFLMPRSDFPILGKFCNKIRVFFARKISKGVHKKAFIQKGAIIMPGLVVEEKGCVGIRCYTDWGVHIGKNTMLGPNVVFFTTGHKRSDDGTRFVPGITKHRPIYIDEDCWIGQNVIVLGGVHIGKGATIGAGSVVAHDVPPYSLAAGNPAVVKKYYVKNSESDF